VELFLITVPKENIGEWTFSSVGVPKKLDIHIEEKNGSMYDT
jgi:hypothetical protein